jgi:hypothetical protein
MIRIQYAISKQNMEIFDNIIDPVNLFKNDDNESILEWFKIGEDEPGHKENVQFAIQEMEGSQLFEFCAVGTEYLKTL